MDVTDYLAFILDRKSECAWEQNKCQLCAAPQLEMFDVQGTTLGYP